MSFSSCSDTVYYPQLSPLKSLIITCLCVCFLSYITSAPQIWGFSTALLLISNLIPLWSEKMQNPNFSIICRDLFYGLWYGFSGWLFCAHWEEHLFCCCWVECSLCKLSQGGWYCCSDLSVLTSFLSTCSASEEQKSLTLTVDLSVSSCGTAGFCFVHFESTLILCTDI